MEHGGAGVLCHRQAEWWYGIVVVKVANGWVTHYCV